MSDFDEFAKDCPWQRANMLQSKKCQSDDIECKEDNCAVGFWILKTMELIKSEFENND